MINTQLPVVQLNGYFLQWFEGKNEKNLYYHCYIRGFTAHYCTRQGGLPNAVSEFYNLTHRRRGEFTFTQGSVDREGLCFTFNR